jgi:hypothetical protein
MSSDTKGPVLLDSKTKRPRIRRTNRALNLAAGQDFIQAHALQIAERAYALAMDEKRPKIALLVSLLSKCFPNRTDTGIAVPFKIETPTSVEHAQRILASIAVAVGNQELDADAARVMTQAVQAWITSHADNQLEAKLEAIERRLDQQDARSNIRSIR